MNIGIIGLGNVGSACRKGFELIGHTVRVHDNKLSTNITNVLDTDIVYICVPTPQAPDGSCDTSIVQSVIAELNSLKYLGIVALKSTSEPGSTDRFNLEFDLKFACVPEFLRERIAVEDFVINNRLLAVGCYNKDVFDIVVQSHGILAKTAVMLTPSEAEILKYYSNVFNATRVVFANIMYEVCQVYQADYDKIKNAYLIRNTATPDYMDCNNELRGYGGMCLPKDTRAIDALLKKLNLPYDLFDSVHNDNQKFKTTLKIND